MDERTRELIDSETNIEVLQAWVKYSFSISKQLEDQVNILRDIIAKEEQEKARLLTGFTEDLASVRKLIFGRKSERRPKEKGEVPDLEAKRLTLQSETLLPPAKENQTKALPSEEVLHEMSVEDLKVESELRGLANASADQWEKLEVVLRYCGSIESV